MSVRKRVWTTPKGETKSAWVIYYKDQHGVRQQETFKTKKAADARANEIAVEVRAGVHVPDSASITVEAAAADWLATADEIGLERSTREQYKQHVDLHIVPFIGSVKLSQLTSARVRGFESRLRAAGRSEVMVRKVLTSLSSLLSDAQERGNAAVNAVRDMRRRRKTGKGAAREKRRKGKLTVGVDIPLPDEVRLIILNAQPGRWRALLLTAAFTGLRASELRGLLWEHVDFEAEEVAVTQRADRYNEIGSPKSLAGGRRVPMAEMVVNTLKAWKLASGGQGFVFGTRKGANPEQLANIANRALNPAQLAAGLTRQMVDKDTGQPVLDEEGVPRLTGKYGMHALRHFFASWCINPKSAGGLEQPAKVVQEWMGHETINITLDMYAHLFPRGDDRAALAAGARAVLGLVEVT